MQMTGAQIVLKSLEDEGVKTIFGIPGGPVIPLYDAVFDSPIKHILVRHEQAAAHAADGFARAGGGVGVCFATSGPGATNLITGISTAFHDSSPILAITGQVSTAVIGTDFFQEAHMLGISLPVVKHSMQVRTPSDIPIMIHDAIRIASTGRPGPVHIDLPVDVQTGKGEYRRPKGTIFPAYSETPEEDFSCIDEAIELVGKSKRPLIIAGNGVNISGAYDELRELAEKFHIPVATSLLGKGTIPGDHELSIGMLGMHGNAAANRAVLGADLIIAVGTRFSDRSTGRSASFALEPRVIHIDIDRAEIHKNINASVWIVGDAKKVLRALIDSAKLSALNARREWRAEIAKMDEREPLRRDPGHGEVHPWQVFDALEEVTHGNITITTEVGQHQMMAALYHKAKAPRRFITSGGQGTMGFGIPASIGAHFARPDLPVVCIAGDGSAMMNIQELDTYARYQLPIKVLVFDNNCLGMVRQWQQLFYRERYSNTIYTRSPDFLMIARGMGIEAIAADDPSTLVRDLERAIKTPGPVLVHIPIPQGENVFPMVPAGASLDEMIV